MCVSAKWLLLGELSGSQKLAGTVDEETSSTVLSDTRM